MLCFLNDFIMLLVLFSIAGLWILLALLFMPSTRCWLRLARNDAVVLRNRYSKSAKVLKGPGLFGRLPFIEDLKVSQENPNDLHCLWNIGLFRRLVNNTPSLRLNELLWTILHIRFSVQAIHRTSVLGHVLQWRSKIVHENLNLRSMHLINTPDISLGRAKRYWGSQRIPRPQLSLSAVFFKHTRASCALQRWGPYSCLRGVLFSRRRPTRSDWT